MSKSPNNESGVLVLTDHHCSNTKGENGCAIKSETKRRAAFNKNS